jgi:methionine-rich copper-binding protein CopC
MRVLDASGRQVDERDASVDKSDGKHFFVSMSSVPAGRYRVVWRVVSVDTHATEGDFIFDVSP